MLVTGLSCAWKRSPPICSTNSLMSDAIGSKPSTRNTSPCSSLVCVRMRIPRQSSGVRIGRIRFERWRKPLSQYSRRRQAVFALTCRRAVFAVERPERDGAIGDDERQLEQLQRRRRPGKAHGGHVAERQLPALDHRDQITGRPTELDDAADQLEDDTLAEPLAEQFAEPGRGVVVDRRGLLVAAKLDDQFRRRVVGHERLCYTTERDG